MPIPPLVVITATTEILRGALRIRVNASYARAVEQAGAIPLVVPPLASIADAGRVLDAADGLLLTGGEDIDPARYGQAARPELEEVNAERDATELALLAEARRRRTPVLAICRGAQLLNVAFGGSLVQDLPSQRGRVVDHDPGGPRQQRVHPVHVESGSRLAAALGTDELTVNSFHHQALDSVAEGLRATAWSPDEVIEGVEWAADDWWALGVQWHPEELAGTGEPWDRQLFAAFVAATGLAARS